MLVGVKVGMRHRCSGCGATSPQWLGRCPSCGGWDMLREEGAGSPGVPRARPQPITAVDPSGAACSPSGLGEVDRVLGGGFVTGSVTLLAGEPGTGKSTLCLQVAHAAADRGTAVLLVCAEETPEQVRRRADRLGALAPELHLLGTSSLEEVHRAVDDLAPGLVIVDSVQTVVDPDAGGAPGSLVQVRDCAQQLAARARERGITTVLVGHVTKEGAVAGPRVLEHLVDTVLSFEGDRQHALRILRATKHRFAAGDEVGLFELDASGLVEVADASARLLAGARTAPGSVIAPVLDGARPMLVEVQALVARAAAPPARRVATGLDVRRLDQLVAVLERRAGVGLGGRDLYASAAGGARAGEPGVDLALAVAIAGSRGDRCVRPGTVALGEVGLGGELRPVSQSARRLAEAARLGYRRAVVPEGTPSVDGLEVLEARQLADALAKALVEATDGGGALDREVS